MARTQDFDTVELARRMSEFAKKLGKDTIRRQDVDSTGTMPSSSTYIRYFKTWKKALEAAGLSGGNIGRPRLEKIVVCPNCGHQFETNECKEELEDIIEPIVIIQEYKDPNLMDRKKLWPSNDLLNFPKTDNISNNSKNILAHELIVWKGHELTARFLRSVNEDYRDEIAKDLLNFFMEYDWNKFEFESQEINKSWLALKKFNGSIETIDNIKYINNSGTTGYQIYRHFFPNIIKIGGSKRSSIYDVLTDKKTLWAVIRNRIGNTLLYDGDLNKGLGNLQYPMPITVSQIIIGAKNSGIAGMGSVYKPSTSKIIYEQYVKDNDFVLDYSAGFGTRLLGLMSCRKAKYCAYEPNTETYKHLTDMINHFGFDAEIKCCGSETELFNYEFDFAFSSPPYFDAERYCKEESQCYNKYPEYNLWLEKYWKQTVINIKKMLKPKGIFAVNVGGNSNDLMRKLDEDLNRTIINEGFILIDTVYMKTSKSHLSSKKGDTNKKFKLEGIFFYEKTNNK